MKRVAEKVKDIVEVCPFTHLNDFAADPGLTLASYHFTDITADLMGKWIDGISSVKPEHGAALALAGFRGVGKSHFLSVIAAIVSRPELRSRISDQHVTSSADGLSRRHNPVIFVRRGTGESLVDELRRSLAENFGVSPNTLSDSIPDLLVNAAEASGDLPLVLLIDTALGRNARVARDDGSVLSEIAEAAKILGIFVGVALDDDISGADGPNSSISASFAIDYLDQEHLYKIVDSHIFSKNNQMRPVLHEIYENYRNILPGFRWSEQRFTALYPLHPATVEIAPLIRLYIHDFALLGFASEAGVKILGRPANSLIGLDEVFDSVEKKLRAAPELVEIFAAYDHIEQDVVNKWPVLARLPAKLLLKGLFLMSLDGRGSTPLEIAASMMLVDGRQSGSSAFDVDNVLDSFAAKIPDAIEKITRDGGESKYCFRSKATSTIDLDAAAADITDEAIWAALLRQASDRFSDLDAAGELGPSPTRCSALWRGATHRGEVIWNDGDAASYGTDLDWFVRVKSSSEPNAEDKAITWRTAELASDEREAVARFCLLQKDTDIRERLGDSFSTTLHVLSMSVEKIWQRVFLLDASIQFRDRSFPLSDRSHSLHSLSEVMTHVLGPVFEMRYPSHPVFSQPLDIENASVLISEFFASNKQSSPRIQQLAQSFALPLGLAVLHGDAIVPAARETLLSLDIVNSVLGESRFDGDSLVSMADVSSRMMAEPFGLTREAQHLVLAALVGQRHIEFVTSSDNRINHRSLDLQIIWDDVIGIAAPLLEQYSPERLTVWARTLIEQPDLSSLDGAAEWQLVLDSLDAWLEVWKQERILEAFDALPDEQLNAAIWKIAAGIRKSYGGIAGAIESLRSGDVSLEQSLQAIADLFSDSVEEYENKKNDLRVLQTYISRASTLADINSYLAVCEMTTDADIENARSSLLEALAGREDESIGPLWDSFRVLYVDYYVQRHSEAMELAASSHVLPEIVRSELYSKFSSVSSFSLFDQRYFRVAGDCLRGLRQAKCTAKVREMLAAKPYCSCGLGLAALDELAALPAKLTAALEQGIANFTKNLILSADELKSSASGLKAHQDSADPTAVIDGILASINTEGSLPLLSSEQLVALKAATDGMSVSKPAATASTLEDFSDLIDDENAHWDRKTPETFASIEG